MNRLFQKLMLAMLFAVPLPAMAHGIDDVTIQAYYAWDSGTQKLTTTCKSFTAASAYQWVYYYSMVCKIFNGSGSGNGVQVDESPLFEVSLSGPPGEARQTMYQTYFLICCYQGQRWRVMNNWVISAYPPNGSGFGIMASAWSPASYYAECTQ